LSIDLAGAARKFRLTKRRSAISRRPSEKLLGWEDFSSGFPAALLLDTNVYIHRAAGRLPAALAEMIDRTLLFHCTVALAELATGIANADPARSGWEAMRDHYTALFAAIPDSRTLTPDAQNWIDAGMVAGVLSRTQGFQRYQRKECLNDALIYLTAAKAGLPVLTANRDDFDYIQQIALAGMFVHYSI
jgi:predicted nucleic acid-binding protein